MRTLILCIAIAVTWPMAATAFSQEEKYLTVEERNKMAMDETRKLAEEMAKMTQQVQEGTFEPPKNDYSQYHYVFDFKNVFGNLNPDLLDQYYKDHGGAWQRIEKEHHRKALGEVEYDYIVLPVQDFSKSNDEISRLLAAQTIARQLVDKTGVRVLEPEFVLRITGDTSQISDDRLIHEIAGLRKARIVHLFLQEPYGLSNGDRRDLYYELAVVVSDHEGKISSYKIYQFGKLKDTEPLEVKIGSFADDITSTISAEIKGSRQAKAAALPAENVQPLPASLASLAKGIAPPAQHAACLQLLAYLTPAYLSSERNHFFERSLRALPQGMVTDPSVRALMARALHNLHRRPMAMDYVEGGDTAEVAAMREYLNGNYYALKQAVAKINDPLLHTLSFLDFSRLAESYGKEQPEPENSKIGGEWRQLVLHALKTGNPWYSIAQKTVFEAMDSILPESSTAIQAVADSMPPADWEESASIETTIAEHLVAELGGKILTQPDSLYHDTVGKADLWALFRNIEIDVLVRQLERIIWLQGRYKAGVEYAEKEAGLLDGLPVFSWRYADGLANLAKSQPSTQKQYILSKAYDSACTAIANSYRSDSTFEQSTRLLSLIRKAGYVGDDHCSISQEARFPSTEKGYQYSADDISPLVGADGKRNERISESEFQQAMATRFDGHPAKIRHQSAQLWEQGRKEQAVAFLWKAVKEDKQGWEVYVQLANYLIEQKDYTGASDAYFSYPEFIRTPENRRVNVSNLAYNVGQTFVELGRYGEARPFFQLCSSIGTGSGSHMASRYLLALIDKDYATAADISYQHWERYGKAVNSYSKFADFAYMASLAGQDSDIIPALERELKSGRSSNSTNNRQLLDALLTHLRKSRAEVEDPYDLLLGLAKTGKQPDLAKDVYVTAFKLTFMDRQLTEDVAARLQELAPMSTAGRNVSPTLASIFAKASSAETGNQTSSAAATPGNEPHEQSDTSYSDLYRACMLFNQGKYAEAVDAFLAAERTSGPLFANAEYHRFALPYAVRAILATKHDHAEKIAELLATRQKATNPPSKLRYDDHLIYALTAASRGKVEQAILEIQKSHELLSSVSPDLSWYQLISTAEWLKEYTGNEKFLELAVEWCSSLSVIHPSYGWAHAFIALHAKTETIRVEAAGYAVHLDPASRWLQAVPESIIKEGAAQYASRLRTPKPIPAEKVSRNI